MQKYNKLTRIVCCNNYRSHGDYAIRGSFHAENKRNHASPFGCRAGAAIAKSLSISHSAVKDHLMRAEDAGLSWPLPEEYND
jgi:hypothetical protein